MKIKELLEYIQQSSELSPEDSVTQLIGKLIKDDHIDMMLLLAVYINHMSNKKSYMESELIEAGTLLAMDVLNIGDKSDDNIQRKLHLINKHAHLNMSETNEKYNYDADKSEREFKDLYNLNNHEV